jgi:hypothetical protein
MGHDGSVDTELEILGVTTRTAVRSMVEIEAEVFAAHLLMPLNRVLPRMRALGVDKRDLQHSEVVYALSLWFGVSYRAMVRQLVALKQVSSHVGEQLLETPPKEIKQSVLDGGQLASWRADVWPLTVRESGEVVHARVGDELSITLPSHASGGFLWDSSDVDPNIFEIVSFDDVSNSRESATAPLIGGAPMRRARIRVKGDGAHGLLLAERRPWQRTGPAALEFQLTVVGMSQPQVGAAEQLRRRLTSA